MVASVPDHCLSLLSRKLFQSNFEICIETITNSVAKFVK